MSSERQPPDDQELEDFLAGRGRIAEAYREARRSESAPAELDAAILAAARDATRATVVRRPRWLAPLALAATLALSLSVLMNIWRDPVLREQAGAPLSAEKAEITVPQVAAEPAPAVMADEVQKKKAEVMKPSAEPRAKSAPPPPPALAPAPETTPQAAPSQELESSVMEESELRRERKSEADLGAAMSAPAGVADDASAPKEVQRQSLSAPAAPARSIEIWIEDIRALRARGDTEAAERELRAFLLAYPDHVLPDDLKAVPAK